MKRSETRVLAFIALLAPALMGMEVMQHREELGTLKEQSIDEAEKEKLLEAQEKSFRSVADALRQKKIVAGTRGRWIEQNCGKPVSRWPEGDGERWMYRSKSGKRLETPWIFVDMGPDKAVKAWECARVECGDTAAR